jgi:hypothetical protein
MISYCIASFRPKYAVMLVEDLLRKTSVPFDVLVWLNVEDRGYQAFLEKLSAEGAPVRIVGKTPENIGMRAYPMLFDEARYELIAQIDDDVVAVSRSIAELCSEVFGRFPRVKQLVADVWQDRYTTGARPPMSAYTPYREDYGLYDGPIDGWFSVFHRSVLSLIPRRTASSYFPLGAQLRNRLKASGHVGLLCTGLKVFHVVGPQYAFYFGMLDFEIEKYRRLGRIELVEWYEAAKVTMPSTTDLQESVRLILTKLDRQDSRPANGATSGRLLDPVVVRDIKQSFSPDGGAEREHNARLDSLGFGDLHYGLVRNLRPHRVLVIGSRYGFVPGVIALALKANGLGALDFVDANYSDEIDGFTKAFGGVGNWGRDASEIFSRFGLEGIVEIYVMRSAEFFERCDRRYGYVYIDGDHSYEGCKYDFERSIAIAEPGAVIALHDVLVKQEGFGVGRVFDEIDQDLYGRILVSAWPGLGIVQSRI